MTYKYEKNDAGHYICTICGEDKGPNQNTMHYHMKKHDGCMPHACQHCHKRFYQKYALDDHLKTRHADKPEAVANLACPFPGCSEKYHKKLHLRVHIARNHIREMVDKWITKKSEGGYSCSYCNSDHKSHPGILYHVFDHAKATADAMLLTKLRIC